jgi:hypothetical protein
MNEQGKIRHVERAQQINDFSGLRYGTITPTDLDGVIELHDKGYIIHEVKYRNAEVPYGQRLCLQRMVKDFVKAGKKAIAIIVEHYVDDTSEPVDNAECNVREIFTTNKEGEWEWRPTKTPFKLKQLTDAFIEFNNL